MLKFTKKPNSAGMYFVTEDGEPRGLVAKVESLGAWGAYAPGEEVKGPRWAFQTRTAAALALVRFADSGDIRQLVP